MVRKFLVLSALCLACSRGEAPDAQGASPSPSKEPARSSEPAQAKGAEARGQAAKAAPPPAPEGAILLEDPPLYVQRCDQGHRCPDELQAAGATHCGSLKLGDGLQWRLPSREEAGRFGSAEGLQALEGFHWTRTPYEQDGQQMWILDPVGGQSTTIPKDRKPFRIRCVATPPGVTPEE